MMIANRRRHYSQGESIKLPDGYTLGEYFNITADIYVLLHQTTVPYEIETLVAPSTLSRAAMIVGFTGVTQIRQVDAGIALEDSGTIKPNVFTLNQQILLRCLFNATNSKLYIDGEDSRLNATKMSQSYIGCFAASKFGASAFRGKVWYIKIFKANELVHYYVPCKDSNGTGKMYDVITERFMTPDAGTIKVV